MANMDKLSKLKKMRMPARKDEAAEMEGMEESPEAEALEGEYDMDMEDGAALEAPTADAPALEAVSDDELLAEIQKRGLMGKMAGEEEAEDEMAS